MTFSVENLPDIDFNRKKAIKLVKVIQKSRFKNGDRNLTKFTMKLFSMMKKVILRNIRNYQKLYNNSPVKIEALTFEEIQSEAYMVLINCVEKYDSKKGDCFYFYLNKSLSRYFYKMLEKDIRNKDRFSEYKQEKFAISSRKQNYTYDFDLILISVDLTDLDKEIIKSKFIRESKTNFIERMKKVGVKVTQLEYKASLNKIQEELIKLQENGEL